MTEKYSPSRFFVAFLLEAGTAIWNNTKEDIINITYLYRKNIYGGNKLLSFKNRIMKHQTLRLGLNCSAPKLARRCIRVIL